MLRNQKNNMFIGLDINKLKNFMRDQKYHFDRTEKDISSIKNLLTSNINKSKLNLFKRNRLDNSFVYIPKNKQNEGKNKAENNELNIKEIENKIWVQETKETFDDLLLGNDVNYDDDDIIPKENKLDDNSEENDENKKKSKIQNDDLENYFINSGYFKKVIIEDKLKKTKTNPNDKKSQRMSVIAENMNTLSLKSKISKGNIPQTIDEDDEDESDNPISKRAKNYSISITGLNKAEILNKKFIKDKKKKKEKYNSNINYLYLKDINQETLLDLLDKQTNKDMEEYLINQLKDIDKDDCCYTNQKLVSEIINSTKTEKTREKLTLAYRYNFECIKNFIDEIFTALLKNIDNIPYIIRAICTIIFKLIKIKFPNMTTIQIIPFISEFLFSNLINHILVNPKFNGIMMFDFSKDPKIHNERNIKIITMNKVLKKLLRGQLYNSSKKNEVNYTLFNTYFIEIMPYVIAFFKNITSVKLPANIEMLIEEKKMQKLNEINNNTKSFAMRNSLIKNLLPHSIKRLSAVVPQETLLSLAPKNNISIEFKFLKMHPEERI